MSNEELEARLLAEATKAIKELVARRQEGGELNLSQMEELVGEFEANLSGEVMQVLVESRASVRASSCPQCEGRLRSKGHHRKRVVTVRGEVEVQREYMTCEQCGHSFFPLG